MRKHLLLIILLSLFVPATTWAGRIPSAKGAHGNVSHFFKRYGGKYKDSVFGKAKVTSFEIGTIEEQAKNLATVEAMVGLDSGQSAHVLLTFKKNPPLGWKVKSWEMLEIQ